MVWLLWPCVIISPNKRCHASAKPIFSLCLGPIRSHLILAKKRTMQPHRKVFSGSHEAKKCQCLCLAYTSPGVDRLRDPSPKAWPCRSCDKPVHHWDILRRQWQRKVLFELEPLHLQCRTKILFKPNVSKMAQALGRLCTFFPPGLSSGM